MSISKDKNKRIHLYITYTDKQGVKHRHHFSKPEWKNLKDAKPFQDEFLASLRTGEEMTVNDLYEHYIAERKMKLKSLYNIKSVHKLYIRDEIGKMKIKHVNQKAIRDWQNELKRKGFSNRYLGKIQDLLRTVFIFGVKYEYIDHNPFMIENVQVEEDPHVIEHWTPEEFALFIDAADNQDHADFFSLLYWTGLRYGEAVALRVCDFDPINGTISVNKTWDAVNRVDTSPKTRNSYRTVVCPSQTKTMLDARLRAYQKAYGYNSASILFGFHTHLSPRTMQHAFERYIQKSGVKRITIHGLRHSHVFMLRESGFDAFDIAKRLGHTVDMVNNTYGQFFLDRQMRIVEKLNEFSKNSTQLAHEEIKHTKKP